MSRNIIDAMRYVIIHTRIYGHLCSFVKLALRSKGTTDGRSKAICPPCLEVPETDIFHAEQCVLALNYYHKQI